MATRKRNRNKSPKPTATPVQEIVPVESEEDRVKRQSLPLVTQLAQGYTDPIKRRKRKQQEDLPPVEIDTELLTNQERMNYVLLLALLAKMDGEADFTQRELDIDETAFNIVFAKTMKGDKISVSIVSAQSGMIKAPRSREEAWRSEQAVPGKEQGWQPMTPFTGPTEVELPDGTKGMIYPADTPPDQLLAAASPSLSPQDMFLRQGPQDPGTGKIQMPFEVGSSPGDTTPMVDLGALTRDVTRSQEVAQSEMEVAARVEREGH